VVQAEIKKESKEGTTLKELAAAGQAYPPELVAQLLKSRVAQEDAASKGWVLDGFPSTRTEANALQQAGVLSNRVLILDIDEDTAAVRGACVCMYVCLFMFERKSVCSCISGVISWATCA
jgi:adenylate kinase